MSTKTTTKTVGEVFEGDRVVIDGEEFTVAKREVYVWLALRRDDGGYGIDWEADSTDTLEVVTEETP